MKRLTILLALCAALYGQQSNTTARNPNYAIAPRIRTGPTLPATCAYSPSVSAEIFFLNGVGASTLLNAVNVYYSNVLLSYASWSEPVLR